MTHARPALWLFMADAADPAVPAVLPTVAWLARAAGAEIECYLEAPRDGRLFARTGSTVLGGQHHHQFNYLHAAFDVSYVLWGDPMIFASSVQAFGRPVLARTHDLAALYRRLLPLAGGPAASDAVVLPSTPVIIDGEPFALAPYCYPEIYWRRALGVPAGDADLSWLADMGVTRLLSCYVDHPGSDAIDTIGEDDTVGSISLRMARRWTDQARGVAFGDPPAILAQLASHCRTARVSVFGRHVRKPAAEVRVSHYTEEGSEIAEQAAALALELEDPVMVGRQTCDGDLFAWSRQGVCLQIIDPNRPAFPVVEMIPHVWAAPATTLWDLEPSDDELRAWAHAGKRLATLVWHSGETAHNEGMLNLCELASWSGLKFGAGVTVERYTQCPQQWELLAVPREQGGGLGLVEPLLHAGGRGMMVEFDCPPERLAAHCARSMQAIRAIAGDAGTPRGYYAFCDTDLATLSEVRRPVYEAIADAGLEYVVSSVTPGRNRIVPDTGVTVINQTCRVVHPASPFVRITTMEELETGPWTSPGWLVATLDTPVIAFAPYIWQRGSHFMRIVEWMLAPHVINVTPRVIARYARILRDEGYLPTGE